MAEDEKLPYFIVHLPWPNENTTLCNSRPFKPQPPEGFRVVLRPCEICQTIARNLKETT